MLWAYKWIDFNYFVARYAVLVRSCGNRQKTNSIINHHVHRLEAIREEDLTVANMMAADSYHFVSGVLLSVLDS